MGAGLVKKYLPPIIGAAIFLGVLYSLGFDEIWLSLKAVSIPYICLTPFIFIASAYLRIYKWVLMRNRMGADISFGGIRGMYFSSKFWGMFSPMRSGEVVPALGALSGSGKLLSIIMYDRVLETFQTLIVFASLFFVFYGIFFKAQAGFALAGVFVVLLLFTFVLVKREVGEAVFRLMDSALSLFGARRPAPALRRFIAGLKGEMEEFYAATRSCFTVGFSLYNLFITFACWTLDMLLWVALFKAFAMNTPLLVVVASVMVYSMMATLTPIPSGLGVADMSFAVVLSRFGYAGEAGGIILLSRAMMVGYPAAAYFLSRSFSGYRRGLDEV